MENMTGGFSPEKITGAQCRLLLPLNHVQLNLFDPYRAMLEDLI